tara:strand:+ start:492 stop:1067 length:576 start_codon:yes stop_codon:yes gene_type:complete
MDKTDFTDEMLIKKFQRGDRNSYTELVNRYKDKIINFTFRYLGDYDLAEDISQETFLKLYIKKDSYREIAKFSTWLYTIAGNLAKTELRKIKRRKTFSVSDLSKNEREFIIVDSSVQKQDKEDIKEGEFLQKSILELDEDFRTIIILREIQELSYETISKILKLPLGTVKSRINRGKLKLRNILIKRGVHR